MHPLKQLTKNVLKRVNLHHFHKKWATCMSVCAYVRAQVKKRRKTPKYIYLQKAITFNVFFLAFEVKPSYEAEVKWVNLFSQ